MKEILKILPSATQTIITQAHASATSTAPVAIKNICERLGLTVCGDSELSPMIPGYIQRTRNNKYTVSYNRRSSRPRQRFTIAHLLAHYLLHRPALPDYYDENVFFRGGLSNGAERQATDLAGEILLPGHLIDQYTCSRTQLSFRDMAAYFDVTPQVMVGYLGVPLDY